jgi:SAM-dependent methyltransferase
VARTSLIVTGLIPGTPHRATIATSLQLRAVFNSLPVMGIDSASQGASGAARPPGRDDGRPDVTAEIREFWDADAATYDSSPMHYPQRPQEQAAWAAALRRLLPPPPAAVLDVGAGTGFLSLLLAAQGYGVTAVDLSPGMLARLRAKAERRGLRVHTAEGDALHPPGGPFDAVVERHLLWTLPDPAAALSAWHAVAPDGRLVVVEGSWGAGGETGLAGVRARARLLAGQVRRPEPGHHDHYTARTRAALPHHRGLTPADAVTLVQASPWGTARIERLRDVEWAILDGRGWLDELLGTHARWAVVAGR